MRWSKEQSKSTEQFLIDYGRCVIPNIVTAMCTTGMYVENGRNRSAFSVGQSTAQLLYNVHPNVLINSPDNRWAFTVTAKLMCPDDPQDNRTQMAMYGFVKRTSRNEDRLVNHGTDAPVSRIEQVDIRACTLEDTYRDVPCRIYGEIVNEKFEKLSADVFGLLEEEHKRNREYRLRRENETNH